MSERFSPMDGAREDRNTVQCNRCKEAMDAPHGPFGAVMVTEWMKQHKCWKPRSKR